MQRLLVGLGLCALVLWGAWIRAHTALADPNFDAHDARGMLRSDPALLYYLTERILESGGGVPVDFGAETRIQHPFATDVPAEFPLGAEFLVAWAQRYLGGATPLHVTALWVMAGVAALAVVGIFLWACQASGSLAWGALAALLALWTPANYRTIGFLLVGEDLSLTLFALHLGWLAWALRSGRARDYLLSGLCVAGALATWHAASFVVTLELGVLLLGSLLAGRSAFALPRSALVLVPPALFGLLVPVLRANGLLVSPAAALSLALLAPEFVRRRRALSPAAGRMLVAGVLLLTLLGFGALAPSSYAHVHQVVWAKLAHLGRFPDDPNAISFDARLLWQGPFETLSWAGILAWSGWPLTLLLYLAVGLGMRRGATGGAERFALGLALVALPAAWMFARLSVLVGLFAPVAAALVFARLPRRRLALAGFGALTLAQAGVFAGFVREHRIEWYLPGPARSELVRLVEWVCANVPSDEPIAGDFVNSTALLAHTHNPIVLQPKYETERSRRQAEAFLTTFFQGTSAELAELLRAHFRCRYLLVDRYVLWQLSRLTAGLRADERAPRAGTAAAAFLAETDEELRAIPGFELLYRGARDVAGADYRLFRLRD
ncbi:MAG: hypothetical protein EXS08_02495 [Planctomycetes bacterium]|nr:hypothetical protein [Planctomycetota bacterium]